MIGWYHTGPKLRASDQEINDLFKRYIAKPVMVIVDVRPDTVGIPTDAYYAVEEIKDVRTSPAMLPHANDDASPRMAQRRAKRSSTFPPPSKQRKPRK